MNKILIMLLIVFLVIGCGQSEDKEEASEEKGIVDENPQEEEVTEQVIELGGLTIYVPSEYIGTGGWEGYRYVNAIIKPKDNDNFEIEIPTNYAHVSGDYESTMSVRNHYTGSNIIPIETDGWRAPVLGYTYVRVGDDFSSFTDFQAEHGASQIIGLFYPTPFHEKSHTYTEIELRVFSGELSDYYEEFENFIANYVDWDISEIDVN